MSLSKEQSLRHLEDPKTVALITKSLNVECFSGKKQFRRLTTMKREQKRKTAETDARS